ncbi:MAG: hypothetical protein HUJ76_03345, partial [Parasporobacterium sp.]|nr:hypothetical protein [Parasporobacterium sp.]
MCRQKGSITIYLALSMVLIMGLVCTLIESARVSCINSKLEGITFMAVDSCFSEFASEVFEDYGIMALWMSEGELVSELDTFINRNLGIEGTDAYQDADLYLMEHDGSVISDIEHLTDEGGRPFEEQVTEYMEYFALQETITSVLDMLGVFREGSKVAAFVDKINEYQDVFIKVGNTVADIQQSADMAKSILYNPKTILGNMDSYMDMYETSGNSAFAAQFNIEYWNLGSGRSVLETCMENIRTSTEDYHVYALEAEDAIDILKGVLDADAEDYSEETLGALRQQVDTLSQKTGAESEEYYRIDTNCEYASAYEIMLEDLQSLEYEIGEGVQIDDFMAHKTTVSYYSDMFSGFDLSVLGLDNGGISVRRENSGFLNNISTIVT